MKCAAKERAARTIQGKCPGDMFVGAAISLFVGMIFCVIMALSFASWQKEFSVADDIDRIAVTYMKSMETIGYLDDTTKDLLVNDLKEIGMENPDVITGTTTAPVEYGAEIRLCITGELKLSGIFSRTTSFRIGDKIYHVDMEKRGTSKY